VTFISKGHVQAHHQTHFGLHTQLLGTFQLLVDPVYGQIDIDRSDAGEPEEARRLQEGVKERVRRTKYPKGRTGAEINR
jgi:hypothetical protein